MNYQAYLFITKRPFRSVAILSDKVSKKEAYNKVLKACKKVTNFVNKKTKFYLVCPFYLSTEKNFIPNLVFKSNCLDTSPAFKYMNDYLKVNINKFLSSIILLNSNRFLGHINYIDEFAVVNILNLYRHNGIIKRRIFSNQLIDDKEKEIKTIIFLKRKFGWLLSQMIYSFLPPYNETYHLDIEVIKT